MRPLRLEQASQTGALMGQADPMEGRADERAGSGHHRQAGPGLEGPDRGGKSHASARDEDRLRTLRHATREGYEILKPRFGRARPDVEFEARAGDMACDDVDPGFRKIGPQRVGHVLGIGRDKRNPTCTDRAECIEDSTTHGDRGTTESVLHRADHLVLARRAPDEACGMIAAGHRVGMCGTEESGAPAKNLRVGICRQDLV
jgi:hypothetical protein